VRLTPLTIAFGVSALSLSSVGSTQGRAITADSLVWTQRGDAALAGGQASDATDAYETAAAIDPDNARAFNGLAAAAMALELPGKAIRFYREALLLDDANRDALAGIGLAFATKGATSQAEASLARLEAVCGGGDCPGRAELVAELEKGAVTAAALATKPVVEQAN